MPETIKIACPNCSAKLRLTSQQMTRRVKCPKCQESFMPSFRQTVNDHDENTGRQDGDDADERVAWTCPGCFQEFIVQYEGEYDLCPDCDVAHRQSNRPGDTSLDDDDQTCRMCGQAMDAAAQGEYCSTCEALLAHAREKRESEGRKERRLSLIQGGTPGTLPLFTTPNVKTVVHRMNLITAECVAGVNLFAELKSAFTDTFGGRSKTLEKKLEFIQERLEHDLRSQAIELEADAVIGVHFQFGQISGHNSIMLWGVAQGTPVLLDG